MSLVQLNGTQCVLILQSICLQRKIVLMSVCTVAADIDDCLRADCKVLFLWVFSFTTLHLLYSGYYLWVLKQHFTSFAQRKFLRFPRSCVPREHEVRVIRGLEEFLACSLSQDACVAAVGRVMDDTLSADSGRRSYLVGDVGPA
jgi:hypothetical protein